MAKPTKKSNDQVLAAQELLSGAFFGILSTHSHDHLGYPFGSATPYALDQEGYPTLLLSPLAQHTKNIEANGRSALTILASTPDDVQQRARLTAIGTVEAQEPKKLQARFFRYYPHAESYLGELGFRFYRFRPIRFHWNAGFATARWFSEHRIIRQNLFSQEQEAQAVQQINKDHANDLHCLLAAAGTGLTDGPPVVAVGIDGTGIDIRQGDNLTRIRFPSGITDASEVHRALFEMIHVPPTDR